MIENLQHRVTKSKITDASSLPQVISKLVGKNALRWYIAQATGDEIVIESTTYSKELSLSSESVDSRYHPGKTAVLSIIPTGVGCSIGGYAGDAAPATNLLASTVDYLITNPNAVNASDFISIDRNVLYTDGCCMDMFSMGKVDLFIPYSNKIGLIIERSAPDSLDSVFNVINAVRAVHGVDIVDYVITEEPLNSRCHENESGALVGTVDNPKVLFEACDRLLQKGVNAIAITSNISDLPLENYARHFEGKYPNPIGGVEAIISYLITKRYNLPAAHAPLMNFKQLDLRHNIVDARGAGEMASLTGLACILIGLKRAPQIKPNLVTRTSDIININNLLAIVTPATCLGGIPVLHAQQYNIPIIAVEENRTVLNVTQESLGIRNVIHVRSYAEAAGMIMALKRGIDMGSISRPLASLRY